MVTTPKLVSASASLQPLNIRWEQLPEDYPIPDDPVDNLNQPLLAAALSDALRTAGILAQTTLTPTNYPICATYNDQMVTKAPDWAYIPQITVPRQTVDRSYTPNLHGEVPAIVLEFLSETDGGEYSNKPTYPPGKWFFYERILQVPTYGIFEPEGGLLELYRRKGDRYELEMPDAQGRHWIPELNLFLGPWRGDWGGERSGYWLRWWDANGKLLLWGNEKADRLAALLQQQGIDLSQI